MSIKHLWPVFLAFMLLTACSVEQADYILVNGRVHTLDDSLSVHQAIAIRDGKIIAVGNTDDLSFKYKSKQVIDLQGKSVFPGFIDAHCHFWGYAMNAGRADLKGTASWDEVIARVQDYAQKNPEGWIVGRGWDHTQWPGQDYPVNTRLNELFPDRPVILRRVDGHAAIANDAALRAAGITGHSRISGGKIFLNGQGRPTGLLLDNAADSVLAKVPAPGPEQAARYLLQAQEDLFRVGITTVDDAGLDLYQIKMIDSLQQAGLLKLKVYAMANPSPENLEFFHSNGILKTAHLHVCSFKFYADGALGSRGAVLLEPYKDAPGYHGLLLHPPGYFYRMAEKMYEMGFQMNTHCIGDSANRMLLRVYASVLKPDNDKRWRIEHAQVVNPADFGLFHNYDVIPSVQPTHAVSDMTWAEDRIGKKRLEGAYAYQSLFLTNDLIALGSDFPVEDIDPLKGIHAAVYRTNPAKSFLGPFRESETMSREDAIKGFTAYAAFANFEEKEKGTIEPGKSADLIIVDEDLMYCSPQKLLDAKVYQTMIEGEIVYSAEKP